MKVQDILNIIDNFAPFSLAYEWDNIGLMCGKKETEVKGICICLDASKEAIQKAIDEGCNVVLTHHPFIFRKIGNISFDSYFGEMVNMAIKNDISIISSHTNIDKAKDGINQRLAEILDLDNIKILEDDKNYEDAGMGRYGDLKNEMTLGEFSKYVMEKLKTPLRAIGNPDTKIKNVAVGGGSCIEDAQIAIEKGCDVFVTGDVKYHEALDFMREGICIIDAGHYATEICVLDVFSDMLKGVDVKVVKEMNKDVYSFVC